MKTFINRFGYESIYLKTPGKAKQFRIHMLVAKAFVPCLNSEDTDVHHIDGNILNNFATNLIWISPQNHGRLGMILRGQGNYLFETRFSENDIIIIRNIYDKGNLTQTAIAKTYNCDPSVISSIVNYKTWKHI